MLNPPGSARAAEILFCSDLHLAAEHPDTLACFVAFLQGRARDAARLVILGDLFDAWIGDDDASEFHGHIRERLRALTDSGTRCDLMHGNRDFLIGQRFARQTGCRLLRDPWIERLGGEPTLFMHGDLLCTDDQDYQRFRRRVRNPLIKWLFLRKSLQSRRAMADAYRQRSRAANSAKPLDIMDVNPDTVVQYLRRFRATRLIHGHTHRPATHLHQVDGRNAERWVLAEWRKGTGEVLSYCHGRWSREPVGSSGST